ncbi:MAG: helix-turn-helix domain-containing protein [Desulfobacterales bacterium]
MDHTQLVSLVNRLRNEPHETEWLEFKENHYEPLLLGEYLSALSNSACLQCKPKGYLIFGIEDKTHEVKGTRFNPAKKKGKNT